MIRPEHMKSCLTAQIRFMLFNGPGSFKQKFKIGGNVDELKGYRLIPLTPPLFFHFTLPLNVYKFRLSSNGSNPPQQPNPILQLHQLIYTHRHSLMHGESF
jgi:hypothetical protein